MAEKKTKEMEYNIKEMPLNSITENFIKFQTAMLNFANQWGCEPNWETLNVIFEDETNGDHKMLLVREQTGMIYLTNPEQDLGCKICSINDLYDVFIVTKNSRPSPVIVTIIERDLDKFMDYFKYDIEEGDYDDDQSPQLKYLQEPQDTQESQDTQEPQDTQEYFGSFQVIRPLEDVPVDMDDEYVLSPEL